MRYPAYEPGRVGRAWDAVSETHALPHVANPSKARSGARKAAAKTPSPSVAAASLTLSSRNYSSWSLRGWLLVRFAGLVCDEVMVSPDDADVRRASCC